MTYRKDLSKSRHKDLPNTVRFLRFMASDSGGGDRQVRRRGPSGVLDATREISAIGIDQIFAINYARQSHKGKPQNIGT